MFDISTLVTDRTQADVQAWNEKGTYNPSDLNRVTRAMEYLVERTRGYGYTVKYEKVKVPHQPQKGKNRLPAGYTELEYIESTGTQYIDTGFKPNQDTRVVGEFEATALRNYRAPFGVRTGLAKSVTALVGLTQTFYNYGDEYAFADYGNTYERMTIDANKNVATFTGSETVTISLATATFTAEYNLLIGSYNNGGTSAPETSAWVGKIYYCQVYDNGTLIRDFVPCKNSSGTVGLYDRVNGVFYTNAGTGTFAVGSVVEPPIIEEYDDYTWYHSDIPQERELTAYLQNVKWLREAMVLYPNTPEVPYDMEGFTFAEANDIEQILVNIETIINLMLSSIIYSGEIFSGEVI